MALNLQQIRDFVRGHLDIEEEDLPDTVLDVFIQEGFTRLALAEKRWPFYLQRWDLGVTADTNEYDLTALSPAVREILAVRGPTWDLRWIGKEEAEAAWPPTTVQTAEPTHYYVENDMLYLFPTPSASITLSIRGIRKASDWIADGAGAEPDLPEELHNTVALWALSKAYMQQDDPEMGSLYERQFADEYNLFRNRLKESPAAQPMVLNRSSMPGAISGRLRYDWEY